MKNSNLVLKDSDSVMLSGFEAWIQAAEKADSTSGLWSLVEQGLADRSSMKKTVQLGTKIARAIVRCLEDPESGLARIFLDDSRIAELRLINPAIDLSTKGLASSPGRFIEMALVILEKLIPYIFNEENENKDEK